MGNLIHDFMFTDWAFKSYLFWLWNMYAIRCRSDGLDALNVWCQKNWGRRTITNFHLIVKIIDNNKPEKYHTLNVTSLATMLVNCCKMAL
jgi:hypothetical protein